MKLLSSIFISVVFGSHFFRKRDMDYKETMNRLKNILRERCTSIEMDLFLSKLREKGILSRGEERDLKSRKNLNKIDKILITKKNSQGTYKNVLEALGEMERTDIIEELIEPGVSLF